MESVRLGDVSAEAYEKGMKLIRDGIAALAEYDDHRYGLGLEDRPVAPVAAIAKANELTTDAEHAGRDM